MKDTGRVEGRRTAAVCPECRCYSVPPPPPHPLPHTHIPYYTVKSVFISLRKCCWQLVLGFRKFLVFVTQYEQRRASGRRLSRYLQGW